MTRALRFLVFLAVLGGLAGCKREFTSPVGHRELGQACAEAAQCASGHCADSVCCDQACGGQGLCNLAGSEGTCVPRPNGLACGADSMCPSGFCRDGVCCDSDCRGNCTSCAVDGGAGTCQFAADNTDPHLDCGPCSACFYGTCGPAFADTDPHGECGEGMTCSGNYSPDSAGTCGIVDGYPCGDDSCAGYAGYCVGWRCMEVTYFHVDDYPLLRNDRHRTPLALAVGPRGDTAILIDTDDGPTEDGGYLGSIVGVVSSSTQGPWIAASIEYAASGKRAGAVNLTGDIAEFAVDSAIPPEAYDYYGYSGIYIQAMSTRGVLQGFADPDPGAVNPTQIAFGSDVRGQTILASVTDGGALRVAVRSVKGVWGDVQVFDDAQASGVAVARAGGDAYLFAVEDGAVALVFPDGGREIAANSPPDCVGPLFASTAPDDGGDQIGLTVTCGGTPYLAAFAPARRDVPLWRFVVAPASSPYYGLEDDGVTTFPLTSFVPSGGRAGAVIYTALEPGAAPGAPQGGYTQTLWLSTDGGIAFSYAADADNGYRYVSMAAGAALSGSPISAFDTVLDTDAGSLVGNSTLLIQTYFP